MINTPENFKKFITHLRFESLALAALMVALTYKSSAPLWILPGTFLIFDVCMIGYLVNPRIGAKMYNFTHNATLPTLLVTLGLLAGYEFISVLGFSWTFHIAIDRVLGYGLKHENSFQDTHLGKIGKTTLKRNRRL